MALQEIARQVAAMGSWLAAWSRWQEERLASGQGGGQDPHTRHRRLLVLFMVLGFLPAIGLLVAGAREGWFR